MRVSPLRFVKYLIGFSIAFIAVSNCFDVLSSSTSWTILPVDDAQRIEQPARDQHNTGLASLVGAKRGGSLLESNDWGAPFSRAELATRASAVSPSAMPFAPNVTATKSHLPAGGAQAGDTLTYTVVIANSGTSDATGVNFSDTIDPNTTLVPGSVIASPIAVDDSYHTIGNVNIQVPVGQGVIANDSNPNGAGTLTVTQVNSTPVPGGGSATASTTNGSVTMSSDGSFSYNPNVAFRGPSDTFTYTLDNGTGKTDTATVTIAVNGLIWFVNVAAAPGGDGRLSSPFNCLVGSGCFDPVAADIANDNIFVYTGAYVGGLTLLSGQKLIGQGAGDTLLNITGLTAPSGTNMLPSTGGTPPTIAATGANITLGSGNTIRGVTLNGTAAAAIDLSGTGFGTVTIAETTLGGLGQALNLTNGTLSGPVASTAAFTSISSTGSSTTGVTLTSVAGIMSSGSTSVTASTGIGISVGTSSAALNFGATSSTLSGGTGVLLLTNTGTVTFGTLDISPNANQRGLLATDNTMTITSNGGAITTSGATAVEITRSSGTTPLVVSQTSVSANGGVNGMKLNNTSGSFTVTGTGSTAGTGGTIQNISARGAEFVTATNITLKNMNFTNATTADGANASVPSGACGSMHGGGSNTGCNAPVFFNGVSVATLDTVTVSGSTQMGININASNNVTMNAVNVSGAGNGLGEFGMNIHNLTGTNNWSGINIHDNTSGAGQVYIEGQSPGAPATFNITGGSQFTCALQGGTTRVGGNLLAFDGYGTLADMAVTVTGATFSGSSATAVFLHAQQTGGSSSLTVTGSSFTANNSHIDISRINGAAVGFNISNNGTALAPMTGANFGEAINVASGNPSSGLMNGTIANNHIGNAGVAGSGCSGGCGGIFVTTLNNSTITANITGNFIHQVSSNAINAVSGGAGGGSSNTINLTLTGNTIDTPATTTSNAIFIQSGTSSVGAAANVCATLGDITGTDATKKNTINGNWGGGNFDPLDSPILLRQRFAIDTFRLAGYTPSGVTGTNHDVAAETFVNSHNTITPNSGPNGTGHTVSATVGATAPAYTGGAGGCAQPTFMSVPGEVVMSSAQAVTDDPARSPAGEGGDTLRAARGEGPKDDSIPELTQERLKWMVQAAIERWRQAGVSAEDLARMQAATFEIADLPGSQIASVASSHIKIDETGAGYGWYIDQFPSEDGEFDVPVPGRELQTTELSPAHGKMDLLTVVMRELGTVYLEGKKRIPKQLRPLMEELLSPAVRRMPVFNVPAPSTSRVGARGTQNGKLASTAPSQPTRPLASPIPAVFNPSAELLPGSYNRSARRMSYAASARRVTEFNAAPLSGETVTLNIGTIPPGESVTIMFQVTINNPLPSGVCSVTNQGHVTGSNFSPVDTNTDVTPIAKAVTIGACPANITTNTDPGVCTAVVNYTTPTGDGCPVPTVTCNPASGTAFPKGTTTVTCTASNGNPPNATCSFTVTVNDNQPPTITCPANVTQGTDPGQCLAVVTYANATATDNCPGVGTPVCTPASGSTFAKGTTTVNCTVSDASGNPASCSFTVTVNDTTPPVITCPANVTQSTDPNQCSAVVTYANATATDNCPGVGTPVCAPASGSTFAKGATTVNCTVSDSSGNSASCSFTVTVNDTQAPAISCPSNVTQSTDPNQCSAVVNYSNATATDNCPGVGTPVCTPASGSTFAKGTTTVNCTVSDASGNPASCSFTVTINDTQAPSIICPANVTQGTDPNQCSAVVTYANATATDNCPGVGTPVCAPASGSTFAKGTTTVNCTVSDASGNPASCSFTVTVNDTQGPTITCPANVTKSTDPNVCTAVVTYPNATATDNCSGVGTPVCTPASGSTFAKGTTTVNCTVSDTSGNSASCSFIVTVKDTQAPTLSPCPSNISVVSGGGCQVVNYTPPTATDNCGSATVTCSPPSGTCFPAGTTTVTCTASDDSPDSPDSSCSFTVTVVPCAITCPNNITTDNDPGQCGAVVTFAPTTSGGGCGTVNCSPSSGSFFPVGTTTVTCSTQAGPSCSFTVTVRDAEAPVITPTSGTIELWPPNHQYHTVTMSQLVASATDNCDGNVFSSVVIASVSSDEAEDAPGSSDGSTTNDIVIAVDCKSVQLRAERDTNFNGRVYTIVLRVRDAAGNVGTASRTVIVPLDQSGGGAILGPGPGYTVTGTCP